MQVLVARRSLCWPPTSPPACLLWVPLPLAGSEGTEFVGCKQTWAALPPFALAVLIPLSAYQRSSGFAPRPLQLFPVLRLAALPVLTQVRWGMLPVQRVQVLGAARKAFEPCSS